MRSDPAAASETGSGRVAPQKTLRSRLCFALPAQHRLHILRLDALDEALEGTDLVIEEIETGGIVKTKLRDAQDPLDVGRKTRQDRLDQGRDACGRN